MTKYARRSSENRLHRFVRLSFLLLILVSGSLWSGEKNPRKVVQVAYHEFNRLLIVDKNNVPVSGYAYDYIQTIGTYAGWDVKYIPCSSFFDGVRLLRAGKVDLFYDISYNELLKELRRFSV